MLSWFVRKNKRKSCLVDGFDIFCLPFEFLCPDCLLRIRYMLNQYNLDIQKGGLKFWLININIEIKQTLNDICTNLKLLYWYRLAHE